MLRTLARRSAATTDPYLTPKSPNLNPPHFPYTYETNPYTCKRTWPPEFTHLSQKHQFRLERRYRRRAKLKYDRPNWKKFTKLAQWGSILFVGVYGMLFMEVTEGETPFSGIRKWYQEQMGAVGEATSGNAVGDNRPTAGGEQAT